MGNCVVCGSEDVFELYLGEICCYSLDCCMVVEEMADKIIRQDVGGNGNE